MPIFHAECVLPMGGFVQYVQSSRLSWTKQPSSVHNQVVFVHVDPTCKNNASVLFCFNVVSDKEQPGQKIVSLTHRDEKEFHNLERIDC